MEAAWEELGPSFLHETTSYGAWAEAVGVANPCKVAGDLDELRATGLYRIVTPDEFADEMLSMEFPLAILHQWSEGYRRHGHGRCSGLLEQCVIPRVGS